MFKRLREKEGFTVVEFIAAVGLFLVVVSIAVGGLVSAMRTQRQAADLLAANSNISLVIEQIGREMRTGYDFCKTTLCPSLDNINFKNAKGESVSYCLFDDALYRGVGGGNCWDANHYKITSDTVKVHYANFNLLWEEAPPADYYQPRITIAVGVSPKEVSVSENVVNIQTTISPRLPLDDGS